MYIHKSIIFLMILAGIVSYYFFGNRTVLESQSNTITPQINFAAAIDPRGKLQHDIAQEKPAPKPNLTQSVATNLQHAWLHLPQFSSRCAEEDAFDYGLETRVGALLLYCYLSNVIDYQTIEQISGMKVFLNGPHTNGKLNLNDRYNFGYYNPEFVTWFIDEALPLSHFAKNTAAQNVYNQYLSHLLPIYLAVKLKLNAHPEFYAQQVEFIKQTPHPEEYPDSPMYRYAEYIEMSQPIYADTFINEATTFWIRRRIDGTDHLFQEAAEKFLAVWDPAAYESLLNKKWHSDATVH